MQWDTLPARLRTRLAELAGAALGEMWQVDILIRQKTAVINDLPNPGRITYPRRELINRLASTRCELCGQIDEVQVHHVRALAELDASDPSPWVTAMTKRRRKALVVCADCHDHIHGTRPASTFTA